MTLDTTNGRAPVALAGLLPDHVRLIEGSRISAEVATQRGYRTVVQISELEALGFAPGQRLVPGLLIPVRDAAGEIAYHQLRPDSPREIDGKPQKYETASKAWRAKRGLPALGMVIDVPPAARDSLNDPSVPLWITEGERKADAAVSIGLCCVDLIGVWGFRRAKKEDPQQSPLPDWQHFALQGRRVYVVFDSDVTTKPSVRGALEALIGFLRMSRTVWNFGGGPGVM